MSWGRVRCPIKGGLHQSETSWYPVITASSYKVAFLTSSDEGLQSLIALSSSQCKCVRILVSHCLVGLGSLSMTKGPCCYSQAAWPYLSILSWIHCECDVVVALRATLQHSANASRHGRSGAIYPSARMGSLPVYLNPRRLNIQLLRW